MYPLHGQIGGQPVGYPELQKQSSKGGYLLEQGSISELRSYQTLHICIC